MKEDHEDGKHKDSPKDNCGMCNSAEEEEKKRKEEEEKKGRTKKRKKKKIERTISRINNLKPLIDNDIKSKIYDDSQIPYIIEKVESRVHEVISSGEAEHIVNESRGWFERNCLPENQIKIIYSFLEDFEIFK